MRFASLAAMLATALLAQPVSAAPTYADLVELSLAAPVIVRATVAKSERLGRRDAPDVAAGRARLVLTATVAAALRAPGAVPASLEYLWEAPLDARGRAPQLKGASVLLFAVPGGRSGQVRLVSARGQIDATAEPVVRAILTEDLSATVPVVTGVASAFHVAGAIAGEGESQFFLATTRGGPVSLVVLSRPGENKRLQVALGDVIDESATGVRRDTLLWYRLACTLPEALPASIGADDRAALVADYAFVRADLGVCARTP